MAKPTGRISGEVKMRITAVFRRLAVAFAAVALFTAARAVASEPPPPPRPGPFPGLRDTTFLGYIENVTIGRAPCDTCPPRVCPGEPVNVTISGHTPSPCIQFRGFRELPVGAPFTLLEAEFVVDTCGVACPAVMVPFSASLSLPAPFSNTGSFELRHAERVCPDTTIVATVQTKQYTYVIEPNCFEPPPVDSLVRTFVKFSVDPPRRCPGDLLSLEMKKRGCHPCVHLTSLTFDSAGAPGFQADLDWRPLCAELVCNPESLSVALGTFAAGFYELHVNVNVHVLGTANPDSVISFVQPVHFEVAQCSTSLCLDPRLPPRGMPDTSCVLTLSAGDVGSVNVPAATQVGVWGVQGFFYDPPSLRILDIQYAGSTPGTYVTMHRDGPFVRFIAFTTSDEPMIPVGRADFLRVTVEAELTAKPGFTGVQGVIEEAAGHGGEVVLTCPILTRERPPIVPICIDAPVDTCDANGDGRADVRDLVAMVSCFRLDLDVPGSEVLCQDCNRDSAFNIADILCCARHILHAPQVPIDSTISSGDVRVSFGEFVRLGEGWQVRVRVSGARALAGALLRLRYPADRWRATLPVTTQDAPQDLSGWMPIVDFDEPGVVNLASLKLGDSPDYELSFWMAMYPVGTPLAGDQLVVELADLVRPDGQTLRPAEALPTASLIDPSQPPTELPARLELGPARPNPFSSTTRFSVSLPKESTIELTVHDVAGRVVATLARGRFPAGVREFAWDGAGARGGVYFTRLSVDGNVLSQRVALIRGR
jgi:hypothetical protein